MHVPASEFVSGKPLFQRISILEGLVGDDDVGEDGVNNGDPAVNGVSTLVISLFPGNAPTDDSGETGFEHTSDNQIDAAVDLTIDFGFQTPVGVGNLVYIDSNVNGFADLGEGVDGVTVELYRADQTPGFGLPIFSRVTSGGGHYFFDSLPAGDYRLHIPPSEFEPGRPLYMLESSPGASSVTATLDDNVDDNENGLDDPTPFLNGISTAVFTLAVDEEPTASSGETGLGASEDDEHDDNNFNLTLDFGFSPSNPNSVGVGNLVFVDLNGNGIYDEGEGIDGVKVQLFGAGADPLTAPPVTTYTSAGGHYIFGNLAEGDYFVFIPPSEFAPGKTLSGWRSIPGDGSDNGIDDNLDENGIDSAAPTTTGIASAPFNLTPDAEPTNSLGEFGSNSFSDDVNDDNTDLTIDFGFFRSVSVGNLVFIDANYNGRGDTGEGVGGVTVELYTENSFIPFDSPVATTVSAEDGTYLFSDLAPGRYFLRVSAWQFDFGMPLYFHASSLGVQSGDDHLGEDGIDNGNPSFNGINTAVFELTPTNAPVGSQEGGHLGSSDDIDDSATNLTLDLGFVPQVTIGNLIFSDANNDGIFDPNIEIGLDGVTVELWSNLPNATVPVATTSTYDGGLYSFNVAPGSYSVRVPATNFAEGGALDGSVPSLPSAASLPTTTAGDDDTAQDGFTPGSVLTDGVRTPLFTLLPGSAPTSEDTETGYLSETDDYADADVDLTVDLGFSPKPLSVGNLVFRDLNANGIYDATDFGVPGVKLRLFRFGDDPNNAGTVPVMETTSKLDGTYLLNAYEAGQYFVHIPASEFAAGGLLAGALSSPGFGDDNGEDDDAGEDGLDAADPTLTGVTSIVFELAYGTEPVAAGSETGYLAAQDAFNDSDADLTLDFGFSGGAVPSLLSIGNLVFNDINLNGVADLGEGVPGVWMLLYTGNASAGASNAIRSTYTDANGRYLFNNLSPGVYTVHVAADNFKESIRINNGPLGAGPLFRCISLRGHQTAMADDNIGEDGIDVQQPELVGITAPPVTLVAGAAPSGADELGFQGTSDDAYDGNVNLCIDFGFATRLGFGNLVFRDVNADGKFQTGIDTGISGIAVELVHVTGVGSQESIVGSTLTDANGAFLLHGPPVSAPQGYRLRIPAAQFTTSGPLSFLVPTTLTTSGSDDNTNQNAQPTAQPEVTGVTTAVFSPVSGALPTDADGREAGFDKTSDNAFDSDTDLTLDIGLKPKAIMVGNLVFRDVNANGIYDAGIDLPMPNVTVRLFQQTQAVTDTPVSEAVTSANGTYMLYATSPAAYYVHIPSSMFGAGAPLSGLTSILGLGNISLSTNANTAKDDRYDENGTDPSAPLLTGVSSGIINLAYGAMPVNSSPTAATGENGHESFMDDAADSSGIMTIDFGFAAPLGAPLDQRMTRDLSSAPAEESSETATFTSWQARNNLAGLNNPADDPDADGHTNLLEYALGTSPASGAQISRFRLATHDTTGVIDALITRPVGEHRDLRYILESSADLQTWTPLSITPTTTNGADQTETLRFADLEAATTLEQGFVRLKVQLDADLNGAAEATAVTPVQGWSRRTFHVGRQTLSMPLLKPAVFIGRVPSVNGTQLTLPVTIALPPETAHYLEVLDGTLVGQTFDIGSDLKLASVAPVAGARVAIRPHWTLNTLLPASAFQSGSTTEESDRALTFDSATNGFQTHPLADESTALRVVPPQEGLFVQIRSTAVTRAFLGEVRTSPLALPQSAGTRFIGTGLALPLTPGSQPHSAGSRLRLWSGDADPATAAYHNYLLNEQSHWIDESTGTDITTQPALDAFRAHFLVK
jgi:hypothetical protein